MPKYKVGDKVFISPTSQYFNVGSYQLPPNVEGTISYIEDDEYGLYYRVEWGDNDNSYREHDLTSTCPLIHPTLLLNNKSNG